MQQQIDEIADRANFGTASAVKRGEFKDLPYVAVIVDYMGMAGRTHNPMGRRAYPTQAEAKAAASGHIDALRAKLRHDLAQPNMRALRQQNGLPNDIT